MKKERYDISGMSCAACSSRVEKTVSELEGIQSCGVNLLTNSMTLEYDEGLLTSEEIIKSVEELGYGAALHTKSGTASSGKEKKSSSGGIKDDLAKMKRNLILSWVFLLILMYISMGSMMGLPVPSIFLGGENALIYAFTQMLLVLPVMYINKKYYIVGIKSLIKGAPNMDSLIALGSLAAFVYGVAAIYVIGYGLGHAEMALVHKYSMNLYFESVSMILTLISQGKYFEAKSKSRTRDAISKLMDLSPKRAVVIREGEEIEIDTDEVRIDDVLIVKPGESIPVDGIIVVGTTSVDESAITGESIPIEKKEGDKLTGATINKNGSIRMRATHVGEDTTISKIIALVEEASSSKAPISQLADKVSGFFVPLVIGISLITFTVWMFLGYGLSLSLNFAISVLVISCPCALGLATPVAIMVGTGKGAEQGILIKSAESLEISHLINTVVLDKTGTVTEGKPLLRDIVTVEGVREEILLQKAASLENVSEHPLAEAIVNAAKQKKLEFLSVKDFKAKPGRGISAILEGKASGNSLIPSRKLYAGNAIFMEELISDKPARAQFEKLKKEGERFALEGKTAMYFAEKDSEEEKRKIDMLGLVTVADPIKKDSPLAIQLMKQRGLDVVLLTGDHQKTADAIAKQAGIDKVIAEVLPQDKESKVRELIEKGRKVAMVGDGINDAPALVRADVGIAIGAGTDIAIESADIVLMHSNLLDVVRTIDLSKAVIRTIRENLFWAFFYNVIGIPLAAGLFYLSLGWKLSPMFGAAAMSLSSVFVVGNALRLKSFRSKIKKDNIENKNKEEIKLMKKELKVKGMMCPHCKASVEKAVGKLAGIRSVNADYEAGIVTLEYGEEADISKVKEAIREAGYEVE